MEKIKLFHNIPDLYKLNLEINNTNIYIKRDDIIDFAFGGNKVRMFEYIAKKIVDSGVNKIITYGSMHSNHVRVAAAVAKRLDVQCDIIILKDETEEVILSGNRKLLDILNVNLVYSDLNATKFIDDYLASQNCDYMWIPGGGHMKEAVYGYIDASKEIIQQSRTLDVEFDAIFLPTGTGTTQTGLIFGLKDCDVDIYGITVARTVDRCEQEIKKLLDEISVENNCKENFRINVVDNMEQNYGESDEEIWNVIKLVAQTDGIFLDPVYNAKAFLGMLKKIKEQSYKNVLYINTGGSPNIFV